MKIKISLLVVLFALTAVGFYFLGARKNNGKPDQSTAKIDRATEKAPEKGDGDSRPEIKDEGQEEKTPSVMKQCASTICMNAFFPSDIWSWNYEDDRGMDPVLKLLEQWRNKDARENVSIQSLFGVMLGRDIDVYTTQFAKQTVQAGESLIACERSMFSGDIIPWNKWNVFGLMTLPGRREVIAIFATRDDDVLVERTNMPCLNVIDRILIEMKREFGVPRLVSSCDYVSPSLSRCWVWMACDDKLKQVYFIVLQDRLVCGGDEWHHKLEMTVNYVAGGEKWFKDVKGQDISLFPLRYVCGALTVDYRNDEVVKNLNNHVVLIHVGNGVGTGFLLRDDDDSLYLYTNAHVVNADGDVKAITMDGKELSLGRVEVARRRDLARMRVYDKRTGLKLALRQPVHGDKIVILGNSDGADVSTVLKGKVLGIGPDTIEVDVRFVTGNSGSPVFNAAGEVVGVATKIMYPAEEGNENKIREGTRFDELRYFATRLDNVEWIR